MLIDEVRRYLESLAPLSGAQDWDNVGLLVGDRQAECRNVLLTIDLTPAVLDEAVQHDADLIMAYHPPLFKSVRRLHAHSSGMDAVVYSAIRHGIAVYSMHTALDAADDGTCDVLARLCGAQDAVPFEYISETGSRSKIVVFVPPEDVESLADALATAGAGVIGAYRRCSFRIPGTGTFEGDETTNPTVGQSGRYETANEIRLEMVVGQDALPDVVAALRQAHTYEEPAFDIYPLRSPPAPGLGRLGVLKEECTLQELVQRLSTQTPTTAPQVIGSAQALVNRVAVLVGAAGSIPLALPLGPADCIVTGEIRHHDALSIARMGTQAIALGHWASERPVLEPLAQRIREQYDSLMVQVSAADRDPLWST